MKKKNNATKKSLVMSAISLVLCVVMLMGTTFAWFTDSVSSSVNKIQAGNLDIEVKHVNSKVTVPTTIEGSTELFRDNDGEKMKWEPGAVSYETFTVSNEGTLALKYNLKLNITDYNSVNETGKTLKDALKVMVLEGNNILSTVTRETVSDLEWDNAVSLDSFQYNNRSLLPAEEGDNKDDFQVIVYWQPTENDNDWNVNNGKTTTDGEALFIDFGINVVASQLEHENDSFDNTYDKDAIFTAEVEQTVVAGSPTTFSVSIAPANSVHSDIVENTTAVFETGALEAGVAYNLAVEVSNDVENGNINVAATSGNAATLNLTLTKNSETISSFNGKTVKITTYIAKGLVDVSVTGPEEATISDVQYDSDTGKLVFTTNHFSEYSVTTTGTYEAYNTTSKKVYTSFITAVNELNTNDVLYVIKDVTYNNTTDLIATDPSTPTGTGPVINVACTIDGMGHEIKNTLSNIANNSRLLSIFDVASGIVEIKNLSLVSDTWAGWFRGISLANTHDMTIKLDNVTIDIPHYYAFNIGSDCQRTNIIMNDCDISGWNTIYNHTSNITLKATNCSFDSSNPTAGGGSTNSFSNVIVAEYHNWNSDGPSGNNKFTFTNCDFTAAKDYPESDVKQVVCDVRSPNHNSVSFNDCTFEDLSTPQYLKVAIDTVFADDLQIRQDMLRTSRIYIDGEELLEDNSILASYIDWDYDDESEDGIIELCEEEYLFDPIPYLGGDINEDGSCTVVIDSFPDNIYTFNSIYNSETGTWALNCTKTVNAK